jgi:hypothetical protein
MEYILGFISALVAILIFRFVLAKDIDDLKQFYVTYSQTHIHEIIKNNLPDSEFEIKRPMSQSLNHEKSMFLRVVFIEDNAYWIKNNTFFIADVEAGMVVEGTAREVDTMGMDRVQLDKMIYIVDVLTEGDNGDRGNTRK